MRRVLPPGPVCGFALLGLLSCENEVFLGVNVDVAESGRGGAASGGIVGSTGGAMASGGRSGLAGSGAGDPAGGGTGGVLAAGCPAGAMYCAGFEETGVRDGWTTWQVNGGALVELAADPTRTGEGSLHVTMGPAAANGRLVQEWDEAILSGPLSARAFFYVPSGAALTDTFVGMELKGASSGGASKASINWAADRSVRLVVTTGAAPATSDSAPQAYELDTWNCAVLRLDASDDGRVEVDINGEVLLSADGDVVPPDGYQQFLLGLFRTAGDSAFEIFYDDVSVAQAALACP